MNFKTILNSVALTRVLKEMESLESEVLMYWNDLRGLGFHKIKADKRSTIYSLKDKKYDFIEATVEFDARKGLIIIGILGWSPATHDARIVDSAQFNFGENKRIVLNSLKDFLQKYKR